MKRFFAVAVLLLSLVSTTYGQTVTVRELPGGATLIVSREPEETNVVIEAFFRVGVADENAAGENGLSALLARTWAGGAGSRSAWLLARDIGKFGALGVWSTGDYIELWTLSGAAEREIAAQTLLLNIVSTPLFLPGVVENAKRDVERERSVRTDGLLSEAIARLRGRIFVASPTGRDPLSDPASLSGATPANLRRFYAKTVGADARRAVFVVAGNIEADDAERMIRSALAAGDWQAWRDSGKAAKPMILPIVATDAIPEGLKPLDLRRAAPSRLALVGFVAPGTTEGVQTAATLHVLDAVLGGGKDCRLFALRDRSGDDTPIAYDIVSRIEAGREQSLWIASVSGTIPPSQLAQKTVVATLTALADGSRPVTDDELARAKIFLKGRHRRERQRLTDRASALGYAQVMGLGATFESDYDAQIDAITVAQVNALAKRIFSTNAAYAVTGSE
ncbi:MAG: insulinase family protein [Fibrella sp.]|nr:insulinase family protein [Armatimonadota bacterium]